MFKYRGGCVPFVRCGTKQIKYGDNDSGRKKCKPGYGGAYGGVWHSLSFV